MAVGNGVALGSNSIPVLGSPFGDPSPVKDGLSLGGNVGDGAGSSERMPQASTTGMTRAANAAFMSGSDSLGTTNRHLMGRPPRSNPAA